MRGSSDSAFDPRTKPFCQFGDLVLSGSVGLSVNSLLLGLLELTLCSEEFLAANKSWPTVRVMRNYAFKNRSRVKQCRKRGEIRYLRNYVVSSQLW